MQGAESTPRPFFGASAQFGAVMKIPATALPVTGKHDDMIRRTTHDAPFLPMGFVDDKGISAFVAFVADKLEPLFFHTRQSFLPAGQLRQRQVDGIALAQTDS